LKKDKKAFDDVTVFTRLSKIGLEIFPITIEDEVKEFSVSRALLSTHFGGSAVATFPDISQGMLQKHGFDKWMCINLVSAQAPRSIHYLRDLMLLLRSCIQTVRRYPVHRVYGWTAAIVICRGRTCGWSCGSKARLQPSGNIWDSMMWNQVIRCLSKSGLCNQNRYSQAVTFSYDLMSSVHPRPRKRGWGTYIRKVGEIASVNASS